jgi:hypothetical protein
MRSPRSLREAIKRVAANFADNFRLRRPRQMMGQGRMLPEIFIALASNTYSARPARWHAAW